MELTELEKIVLEEICRQLAGWRDDEPGYSCIDGSDITKALQMKPKVIAGVISSLCKKGLIDSEDGGDFDGIIYPNWDKIPNDFGREESRDQKRSKLNPYFALDLDTGIVKDEYGETYTIEQFREIINKAGRALDMTMMCARLIQYDYDLNKLKEFYQQTRG